jgi:hypothetical protein
VVCASSQEKHQQQQMLHSTQTCVFDQQRCQFLLHSVDGRRMKQSMEQWANNTDGVKGKHSDKSPYQWHFVRHKLNVEWPGIEPVLRDVRPPTNCLSRPSSFVRDTQATSSHTGVTRHTAATGITAVRSFIAAHTSCLAHHGFLLRKSKPSQLTTKAAALR